MIYVKRLFSLIIGIPLFIIISFLAMIELLFTPIKQIINYIIYGNSTKYATWFGWIALPIMKLLQKFDLIDKDIKFK
jgi:hypothetical protein